MGSGFRIAALDLELRGAGNLLGREQHGHINAVGFDLYCQMLEQAVARLKGESTRPEVRVTLNLGLDVRIPPDYIPGENARLRAYKRIAAIGDTQAVGATLFTDFLLPFEITSMLLLVAIVGVLAGALPAWRASRIDPVTALRAE